MTNKLEKPSRGPEAVVPETKRVEPPPLPAEALKQAKDLVFDVKASGMPHVRAIVLKEELGPEDDDVIDLTEKDLIEVEDEADTVFQVLTAELMPEPPPLPKELPPPLPQEALSQKSQRSTKESLVITENQAVQNEKLMTEAADKIGNQLAELYDKVQNKTEDEEVQVSDVKIALYEVMSKLFEFADVFVNYQQDNEKALELLNERLLILTKMRTKAEKKISEVFEEIFQEFGDIIDERLVYGHIEEEGKRGRAISVEDATKLVYFRTPEEMEEIKVKNRAASAKLVTELAEKPGISLADIEALHMANNKGIVPKKTSRIRTGENQFVNFLKRFGVFPKQVQAAMQDVVDRANILIANGEAGMGKRAYGIEAAKLHNDMLDIHPFSDRNGSTSMLFLETLMARRGYVPSPHREKKYYTQLKKVLKGNLIAMGVVGYQQVVIAQKYGYYLSPEIAADPELKALYDKVAQRKKDKMKKDMKAYSFAVKAEKKEARGSGKRPQDEAAPPQEKMAA